MEIGKEPKASKKQNTKTSTLNNLKSLLSFLTALPVGPGSIEAAAQAYPLTPLVGLLIGTISTLAALAVLYLTGSPIAAGAVYTGAHVLATGGIHLDGLADISDMLHSGRREEEALEILKDPRRGAGAIIGVSMILILQTAFATALLVYGANIHILLGLVGSHVFGYESMYLASWRLPGEPYRGLARVFQEWGVQADKPLVNLAIFIGIILMVLFVSQGPGLGELMVWLVSLPLLARWPLSRLGYANGDLLGFLNETSRTMALLGALLGIGIGF